MTAARMLVWDRLLRVAPRGSSLVVASDRRPSFIMAVRREAPGKRPSFRVRDRLSASREGGTTSRL